MTFESVGGQSSGPDYVYPYNFSIDGSTTPTPLMCLSFTTNLFGESWKATIQTYLYHRARKKLPGFSMTPMQPSRLVTLCGRKTISGQPGKFCTLVSPPDGGAATQLTAAQNAVSLGMEPSFYQNFVIYAPVAGTESEGGMPQFFTWGF